MHQLTCERSWHVRVCVRACYLCAMSHRRAALLASNDALDVSKSERRKGRSSKLHHNVVTVTAVDENAAAQDITLAAASVVADTLAMQATDKLAKANAEDDEEDDAERSMISRGKNEASVFKKSRGNKSTANTNTNNGNTEADSKAGNGTAESGHGINSPNSGRGVSRRHRDRVGKENSARAEGDGIAVAEKSLASDGNAFLDQLPSAVSLKVLVVGAVGCGKTSFIKRCVSKQFVENSTRATVGCEMSDVTYITMGKNVRLAICDMQGADRNIKIQRNFFRNTHAVFVAADANRPSTLATATAWIAELKEMWAEEHEEGREIPLPCFLLVLRADMQDPAFPTNLSNLAMEHDFAQYYVCSAKDSQSSVDLAMMRAIGYVLTTGIVQDVDQTIKARAAKQGETLTLTAAKTRGAEPADTDASGVSKRVPVETVEIGSRCACVIA